MSFGDKARFIIIRTIGNFLLLFAIYGVVMTFGPAIYYEVQFRIAQARGINYTVVEPATTKFGEILKKDKAERFARNHGFADILAGPKEQILIPKDTDFNILIPKLGANAKVIPNVDPSNDKEFLPALQKGVAHAKGTVFPGQKGNIYLFAHSVDNFWDVGRYNAIFYLLKDMNVGDDVVIFFESLRHNYTVTETKIIDPSEVQYLVNSQHGGDETLILQTCWPPGTTWKRLLVIAKAKK